MSGYGNYGGFTPPSPYGLAQTEATTAAEVSQADADQDLTQVASQEISEKSGLQFAQTKSHSDGLHQYHKSYEKHNSLSQ